MNQRFVTSATLLLLLVSYCLASAQEDVMIVAPISEAAEGLDLKAVSELFKDSESLEEFEQALNDSGVGINNLDLDENGEVDFIRVVEEVADDTHVIILQVPLAENEFQDVATIEVEKTDDDGYDMQVHGNDVIYGVDYYMAPSYVHIHTWPIITWIYRPVYRPYRSRFYFGFYPRWWRPHRPVTFNVHRTHTVRFTRRPTFSVTRVSRVKSVTKINYKPRSSTLVKKKTKVSHTSAGTKGVKKVTKTTTSRGKATTVKKDVKKTKNKKTGKTTVKKGAKKTTKTKGGKKKTVKKGGKKNNR